MVNWNLAAVALVIPALLSIAACGAPEEPPQSVIDELARLEAAGVASADKELERMRQAGVVNTAGSTQKNTSAPDATLDELAKLKAAGNTQARTELDRIEATNRDARQALDASVALVRFSATDDTEADRRVKATRELTTKVERGKMSNSEVLDHIDIIAPNLSISERKKAANRIASISDESNGELTPQQKMQVANELSRLATGHGIDAERRTEAAREIVRLQEQGDLNPDNASELMATIAPEFSIQERKEALGHLAWQFSKDGGDWSAEGTKRTAEEGYRLITGGEAQVEKRMESGVELTGEAIKRFGGDTLEDRDVDIATEMIKQTLSGDLSTDSVSNIMGWGN